VKQAPSEEKEEMNERLTLFLFDQVVLIIDDTDLGLGQVLDRLIHNFPELFGYLADETYYQQITVEKMITRR
jgi:hypothetical protein